ncbi:unnamed protein product [Lactuca virosa]|uniref:Late embryogenesis abundant protein LEA-2 subgroup domain-containing protein n=1 Tax=Lactuca virosa TaxID=75947 RepID=A0AAU9NNN6_9ASTR|nr:unnamed protein product [Lactuca virosa]
MDIEKKDEQPLRSSPLTHTDEPRQRKRRRCIICCASVTGVILTILLVLLILGLTVFKAKKPVMTVNSVALQDLNVSFHTFPVRVSLNLSLDLGISIENPNKVGVKYKPSSASLLYRGNEVGQVPIPAGEIGSDDTRELNLTVTVFADRLLSDSDMYRDLLSGNLPFTTYTRIKAKVRVLFIHIHVTSISTCDVNIDIVGRRIANQTCNYQNSL